MCVTKHPPMSTRVDDAALKQPTSSLSTPPGSLAPAAMQFPPSKSTPAQYSKWPISSEKATLYAWAVQGRRVSSLEVLYIGWKADGRLVQVVAVGSNLICAKPFATLAVIEPVSPVVKSLMMT